MTDKPWSLSTHTSIYWFTKQQYPWSVRTLRTIPSVNWREWIGVTLSGWTKGYCDSHKADCKEGSRRISRQSAPLPPRDVSLSSLPPAPVVGIIRDRICRMEV